MHIWIVILMWYSILSTGWSEQTVIKNACTDGRGEGNRRRATADCSTNRCGQWCDPSSIHQFCAGIKCCQQHWFFVHHTIGFLRPVSFKMLLVVPWPCVHVGSGCCMYWKDQLCMYSNINDQLQEMRERSFGVFEGYENAPNLQTCLSSTLFVW
jgi:hypothetical protein